MFITDCLLSSSQLLQNDLEVTKVDLSEIIPAATIMVVSVTASTTQGLVNQSEDLWFSVSCMYHVTKYFYIFSF